MKNNLSNVTGSMKGIDQTERVPARCPMVPKDAANTGHPAGSRDPACYRVTINAHLRGVRYTNHDYRWSPYSIPGVATRRVVFDDIAADDSTRHLPRISFGSLQPHNKFRGSPPFILTSGIGRKKGRSESKFGNEFSSDISGDGHAMKSPVDDSDQLLLQDTGNSIESFSTFATVGEVLIDKMTSFYDHQTEGWRQRKRKMQGFRIVDPLQTLVSDECIELESFGESSCDLDEDSDAIELTLNPILKNENHLSPVIPLRGTPPKKTGRQRQTRQAAKEAAVAQSNKLELARLAAVKDVAKETIAQQDSNQADFSPKEVSVNLADLPKQKCQRYATQGICRFQNKPTGCSYEHVLDEGVVRKDCKQFCTTGVCSRQQSCQFFHPIITTVADAASGHSATGNLPLKAPKEAGPIGQSSVDKLTCVSPEWEEVKAREAKNDLLDKQRECERRESKRDHRPSPTPLLLTQKMTKLADKIVDFRIKGRRKTPTTDLIICDLPQDRWDDIVPTSYRSGCLMDCFGIGNKHENVTEVRLIYALVKRAKLRDMRPIRDKDDPFYDDVVTVYQPLVRIEYIDGTCRYLASDLTLGERLIDDLHWERKGIRNCNMSLMLRSWLTPVLTAQQAEKSHFYGRLGLRRLAGTPLCAGLITFNLQYVSDFMLDELRSRRVRLPPKLGKPETVQRLVRIYSEDSFSNSFCSLKNHDVDVLRATAYMAIGQLCGDMSTQVADF
jgi:hypothetical protein